MGATQLRDLVARLLWQDKNRLRVWDTAKDWAKKQAYRHADEALKRSGIENCIVPDAKIGKSVENVR